MKKLLSIFVTALLTGSASSVLAQNQNMGIGTTSPDNSAVLDIHSVSKGLLIPRMNLQERNTIPAPANGLLIYQTGEQSGFFYFNGQKWSPLSDNEAKSISADPNDWETGGNIFPIGSTPVLGTYSNNVPLKFVVNNQQAGLITPTSENTFLGYFAGLATTGGQNVGLGASALQSNISGDNNIAIGRRAMYNNNSGYLNVAIGSLALRDNLSGKFNIAIGYQALLNSTGDNNIAIGLDALKVTTGIGNTAIGTEALASNTTASNNFALGRRALYLNNSGQDNFALGNFALSKNISGSNNLALGVNAGRDVLGSGNVFVGFNAGLSETSSNKLYISNSSTDMPLIYGDFNAKFIAVGDISPTLRNQAFSASGGYNLLVKGGILTEKVKVALAQPGTDWADYVFADDYKLASLKEVEEYIDKNKHLPNVPSTEEMMNSGNDLIKTDAKLLEKIEELTLYVIALNKEIQALKAKK